MFVVTEINRYDQFLELRNEWNRVLKRSRDKNVFLTWEYLAAYWKHFGGGKKLRILSIEDKDEIIAIAPLRQMRYGSAGLLGYEVIEPMGYRGLTPEGADYTGLILTERKAECLELFLDYLVEHDSWDFIYLIDIPEPFINPDLLAKVSKDISILFESEEGVICPYITIPDSMDIFLSELDGKFRKNLRRCMKNLQKDYQRVELKKYDEFGSIEEAMRIFFELHQKRWQLKNVPGVFSTQKIRDFYLDVAKFFAHNRWLALYFLTVDDEPIATQYCFEYERRMYYALGGFDPSYFKYSAGNLVLAKVIEKCIERGIEEYDLLKGGESYKFRYTAKYRRTLRIKFVNRRFTSNLYNWGIRTLKQTKMDRLFERFFSS